MTSIRHHVVIGSGVAGNQAAGTLRSRDPDSRVTMITISRLPFFNRYDLPRVFRGERDWRRPTSRRRFRVTSWRATVWTRIWPMS